MSAAVFTRDQISAAGVDRRQHPRIPSRELTALTSVRIRHRDAISLVDLSSGGALIELPFQVRPNSQLTLELRTTTDQVVIPFQLLRCYVTTIKNGIRYRAAGAFERDFTLSLLPGPADLLLKELDTFRCSPEAAHATGRGMKFIDLVDWTMAQLRRGDSVAATEARITEHVRQLFPIVADTSTSVSTTPGERRFLQAIAHLISLLRVPSLTSPATVTRVQPIQSA